MREAGCSANEIRRARDAGIRLRRGVYVPKPDKLEDFDPRGHYVQLCRAVLACLQPGAVLTGPSAAAVLDLPVTDLPTGKVSVRNVARGRYAKDVHVMNGKVATMLHDGMLLAEPAVIAADCARMLCARDAMIVADAMLHEGLMQLTDLQRVAGAARGSHGAARVRWVADNADPAAESPGETWTRIVLRRLGYEPRTQVVVGDDRDQCRVDLLIDGVALEFDGVIKYRKPKRKTTVQKVVAEKLRRGFLQSIGFAVLEVLWQQLFHEEQLLARLRFAGVHPTALAAADGWSLLTPAPRGRRAHEHP